MPKGQESSSPAAKASKSESLPPAQGVSLADFSTALSDGVLRAIDARGRHGLPDWRPWIWAGWMLGDSPFGRIEVAGTDAPGEGGATYGPLLPRDHTTILRAIMDHAVEVVRNLPDKSKSAQPSQCEVLEAALRVPKIDDYAKRRIRAVLDILRILEEARSAVPASVTNSLDDLRGRLEGRPVESQLQVLRDREVRRSYSKVAGMVDGMEIACQIIEDGRDSIYSPDFHFYVLLADDGGTSVAARDVLSDVASCDEIGGVAGGAVGALAAGVGAGPGAVAGAAGASAGCAIGAFLAWLF